MKMDFLQDLDARNLEHEEKYKLDLLEKGDDDPSYRPPYPSPKELDLVEPHTLALIDSNLYNQLLPHIGTVIVEMHPRRTPMEFEQSHGFSIEDIGRLVDYAKEKKNKPNLRFVLSARAVDFHSMDYVEPILKEFSPFTGMHLSSVRPKKNQNSKFWFDEAGTLLLESKASYRPELYDIIDALYGPEIRDSKASLFEHFVIDYAGIRNLGYDKIADEIMLEPFLNPKRAFMLLLIAKNLILWPNESLTGGLFSYDRRIFENWVKYISPYLDGGKAQEFSRNADFPCEIGQFLNEKLKLVTPKNIHGVLEVSDYYKDADLSSLVKALNFAVDSLDAGKVLDTRSDFNEVLKDTWNNAISLRKSVNVVRHGISLGLAVIGAIATMPIGGIGGLLAGLGFEVLDKALEETTLHNLSKKVVASYKPNHLLQIYNFQEKYRFKE